MSISTEDYLKTIYKLQSQQSEAVKTSDISQELDISPASVSEKLKKLSKSGFLTYSPYKGVLLTGSGYARGQNMVRRHRILELFLSEVLQVPWEQVHEEAEKLEHAASDALINRMEKHLGFPQFDPHGDPIPSRDGSVPSLEGVILLSECPEGSSCEVTRVSDFDQDFLSYIQELGLGLKKRFTVKTLRPFDRSLRIEVDGNEQNISHTMAQNIWVTLNEKE